MTRVKYSSSHRTFRQGRTGSPGTPSVKAAEHPEVGLAVSSRMLTMLQQQEADASPVLLLGSRPPTDPAPTHTGPSQDYSGLQFSCFSFNS